MCKEHDREAHRGGPRGAVMNRTVGRAGVPFPPVVAALLPDRVRCGGGRAARRATFTSCRADALVSRHFCGEPGVLGGTSHSRTSPTLRVVTASLALPLIRFSATDWEPCRSPAQFRALPPEERDRPGWRWALVRADHPAGAVALVMARLCPDPGNASATWREVGNQARGPQARSRSKNAITRRASGARTRDQDSGPRPARRMARRTAYGTVRRGLRRGQTRRGGDDDGRPALVL